MNCKKAAGKFFSMGLNPVPVKLGTKEPARKGFTELISQEELTSLSFEEVGISTGYSSGNLEVLDFDTKNVESPDLFMESYNSVIPKELLNKLLIQRTGSGGFHYIYRCPTIFANQKLARNKSGEATIETRGIGGYIKTYPSKGYSITQGKFSQIPTITEKERALLMNVARQRDELLVEDVEKRYSKDERMAVKRFPNYNTSLEIAVELLEECGWEFHSENEVWYNLSRPDSSSKDLHGGFNKIDNYFHTFSTSVDNLQSERGYLTSSLFAELKFNGDYKKAYRELYNLGYGIDVDFDDSDLEDDLDFLSDSLEEDEVLNQIVKGDIPMGVSTGWTELDPYFVLKKNHFYFLLGVENIGKSTFLSSLMSATKTLYGYKWGVSSPESSNAIVRRNLIQADAGRKLQSFSEEPLLYSKYLTDSRNHFFLIRNDRHWGLEDILEKGKELYQKHGIDFLLIDPYSFYDEAGDFKKDQAMMSKLRVFALRYCSVIVVDHTNTEFVRKGKDENGFLTMPSRYDASGGNMKVNKCDDFIVIHRIGNHPDNEIRRTMQVSMGKVKDEDTGGSKHLLGDYSELEYYEKDGFTGYWDSKGNNPMYKALKAKSSINKLPSLSPSEAF